MPTRSRRRAPWRRFRRCGQCDKLAYPDRLAAEVDTARVRQQCKSGDGPSRVYPCPAGNGFHGTSRTRRRR